MSSCSWLCLYLAMSCYVCLSHASFLGTGSQANLHLGRFAKAFVSLISYLLPPSLLPSFFLPPWKFIFDINVLALKYFGFPCCKWFCSGRDSVQVLSVRFFRTAKSHENILDPLLMFLHFLVFLLWLNCLQKYPSTLELLFQVKYEHCCKHFLLYILIRWHSDLHIWTTQTSLTSMTSTPQNSPSIPKTA